MPSRARVHVRELGGVGFGDELADQGSVVTAHRVQLTLRDRAEETGRAGPSS